ncbi:hypothetical protein EW146_g2987 [Bondarzewia mesenterica]|uniref:Uncharacterized protein n=1 Tax=Bondarzewia mesenterica TaxID=1095465 RepID=A0A4S4LZ59_9AGAM|nr:hypothetical protein EW146_g2987 [Bondarzewia mesenterica]
MHFPQLECRLLSASTSDDMPDLLSESPRLQRLWLEICIPWSKYRFSCLTHLALSGYIVGRAISMAEFLDVLRENAGLQVLVLNNVNLILGRADRPQAVELPHLRYLVVNTGDTLVIRNVISTTILPSPITTRFRIYYTRWQSRTSMFPVETRAKPFFTHDTAISVVAWRERQLSCFFYNLDYKFEIFIDFGFTHVSLRPYLPVKDISCIRELSLEISSKLTHWTPSFFHSTPGLYKLTISANTSFDCVYCFSAILRGALPELKTLCVHIRDVTGLLRLSPLLRLVRQRHVDGRPLKKVAIHNERLKAPSPCVKTLRRIARYIDRLELDSSPSSFGNSKTGFVYASLPNELSTWRWRDEFG